MKNQDPPHEFLEPIIDNFNKGKLNQALSDSNRIMEKFPNSIVPYLSLIHI